MARTTTIPIAPTTGRRPGGRPTAEGSAARSDIILDAALRLFLAHGFGGTSIERVATEAGVSKRTLYARFAGKTELFQFAVAKLIETWRTDAPEFDAAATNLEDALRLLARPIMRVGLAPAALDLYRLIVSEAARFPELPGALRRGGSSMGIERIAAVLERHCPAIPQTRRFGLAERFLDMLLGVPRNHALGLGDAFDAAALVVWIEDTVRMFCAGLK